MGWGLCISEFPLWLRYGTETNSSPRMWWLGPGNYRWTASSPQTSSKSLYVFVYIFNSLYAVHTNGELKSVVKIMKSFSMPDDFYYCFDQQKASDSWFCTWLCAVIFNLCLPMLYLCYIFDLPVYFRVAQAHLAGDRPSMTDWESQPVTGTHNRHNR